MKLGALNAAIDAAKGKIKVRFSFGYVAMEKGDLKLALKTKYDSKSAETNLRLVAVEDFFHLQWEPDFERRCGSCGAIPW